MKSKCVCLAMLVFLSLVLGRAGSAQEIQPLEPDWLQQMYEEGWQKIQEGVLRRDLGEGRVETFSYGAEGFQWLIEKYSQQLSYFEGEYRESPSDELASLIDRLRDRINAMQDEALTAQAAESFEGSQLADCTPSHTLMVDAGALTSTQGVMASASADFNSTCEITGSTFASAWAKAGVGTVVTDQEQSDPKDNGTQLVSRAYASMNGSLECESIAMASVTFLGETYSAQDRNTDCPDIVSIAGPTQVPTDYYGQACADVTWTATTASGRTDYTFEWYIGTTQEGTGTTLTKRYCNEATSVTPRVVASDGAGWSDEATFSTDIQYTPPVVASVSGPTIVSTDSYSSPCTTVTWTASATGGHPGHTYSWYIGTDPTAQGTGNTFSKSYCNSSQSATVKVVAQDSDGHTDDAIHTTNIQYIGPIAALVSGPSTVTTDSYGSTCATATWTASATGGHPGYTYNWHIGTDPTVQGTGTTFSKSYCSTNQSVTVKVIARDSDGHTSSATKTTTVQHIASVAASVSGPATVTTDSYGSTCADATWTASATGGHPGYTYSWYIGTGTTVQGTGRTFTKNYCSTSQSVTVKVVARDSDGHTASATFTTSVQYRDAIVAKITGPAPVSTNSTTPCADVTWTASASGSGHSGYTYKWYLGTSTTIQGTASTLTKRYCSTTTTVTVKLVATASDGHADDVTFTTNITHTSTPPPPPPLSASISGESEIELYSPTDCYTLTWSANVSGGTPAYSYSWTIGTSTTVLSTTSSLTKRVCTPQTLNVKLTVRDSASQSANATFTTWVGQL